ncbi:MAG TPA: epoxide hydrolase [Rhizomicrobium sp.]|nr:epoxide hydrolase [Rhizomicrobium sp.]
MKPFKIDVAQTTLDAIRARVRGYDWHEMPRGDGLEGSWAYGANFDFMRQLCAYWADGYDWRRWEAALNAFPQFTAAVEDIALHFYREIGSGPAPKPLILSHGWPGSVFEFLHVIDALAHPEKHGGEARDAFTVIVPSLPGYGWSGKPRRPIGPRTTARLFDTLMTQVLGLPNYIAQGGDWGSAISAYLSYEGKGCRAAHLNMMGWVSPGAGPQSEEEKAFAAKAAALFQAEGAYFLEQTTKPQTLSYAMMDSPVGVAAWIVEKFHGWSDTRKGFENTYTKDQLLTNVMIYLVTRSFNTATWMYRGRAEEQFAMPLPKGARLEKPTGIAAFPVDLIPFPPRSQVERSINVTHWTSFEEGGHFAALERPEDLVGDIRAFARTLDSTD